VAYETQVFFLYGGVWLMTDTYENKVRIGMLQPGTDAAGF
jgi:hypothetical protein